VSIKTVSRVVNRAHVSEETRTTVERAISALGYRPNLVARSLRTSRSFLIAAITPRLEGFYWHTLHSKLIQACREKGFDLLIEYVKPGNPEALQNLEIKLRHLSFEGVVLYPAIAEDTAVMDLLDRLNVRYVRIFPLSAVNRSDAVFVDEDSGIRLLAEHLWNLGHRDFAIAAGPPQVQGFQRAEQLQRALLKLGAARKRLIRVPLNWHGGGLGLEAGRQLAATVLSRTVRPTAVFTHSDEVAAGVVGYFIEHGLQVPSSISVAGFNDADIAQAIWPPLTTIRLPIEQMALSAISLLLSPDEKGKVRQNICSVELIVRRSTGSARASK
jgi:LacI family transcriptional regulator